MKSFKFKLLDKKGNHVGYEYHEPNEFGVIQIYHDNLATVGKQLVMKGYFIPHFSKEFEIDNDQLLDIIKIQLSINPES